MSEIAFVNPFCIIADHPTLKEQPTIQDQYSWYQLSTRIFDSGDKKYCLEKLIHTANSPQIIETASGYPVNFQKTSSLKLLVRSQFDIQCQDKDYKILLLEKILNDSPSEETAWVWLSLATDIIDRKIMYLKKVLQINPDNENAEHTLKQLFVDQNNKKIANSQAAAPAVSAEISNVWENIAVVTVIIAVVLVALSFGLIGFLTYKAIQNGTLTFLAGMIADIISF